MASGSNDRGPSFGCPGAGGCQGRRGVGVDDCLGLGLEVDGGAVLPDGVGAVDEDPVGVGVGESLVGVGTGVGVGPEVGVTVAEGVASSGSTGSADATPTLSATATAVTAAAVAARDSIVRCIEDHFPGVGAHPCADRARPGVRELSLWEASQPVSR